MSGGETPGGVEAAAGDPGRQLSALLEGFEAWLRTQPALGPATPTDGPDLATLLREFVALRQEINLLTRAARTQQEQNAATLQELADALAALRQRPAEAGDEAGTLQLKSLLEVRDALGRAEREIHKARANLEAVLLDVLGDPEAEEPPLPPLPPVPAPTGWARWLGYRGPDLAAWQQTAAAFEAARARRQERVQAARRKREEAAARVRQIVGSLVEGYGMSVQRLDRLLTAHEVEAIPAQGQRFDPELMEALDTVADTGRPAGEVVEEVRRGYRHRGRVLRFALVRVAKD